VQAAVGGILRASVGRDPILRPLFPGKSLRCAIEEFAAFLIQFLGGCEEQTQYRRWLSLRESHARFQIGLAERTAWLKHMGATLEEVRLDEGTRKAFGQFFLYSSAYIVGKETADPQHGELAARWSEQRVLDEAIGAIEPFSDFDSALNFARRLVGIQRRICFSAVRRTSPRGLPLKRLPEFQTSSERQAY
jgi:hemoglobin